MYIDINFKTLKGVNLAHYLNYMFISCAKQILLKRPDNLSCFTSILSTFTYSFQTLLCISDVICKLFIYSPSINYCNLDSYIYMYIEEYVYIYYNNKLSLKAFSV